MEEAKARDEGEEVSQRGQERAPDFVLGASPLLFAARRTTASTTCAAAAPTATATATALLQPSPPAHVTFVVAAFVAADAPDAEAPLRPLHLFSHRGEHRCCGGSPDVGEQHSALEGECEGYGRRSPRCCNRRGHNGRGNACRDGRGGGDGGLLLWRQAVEGACARGAGEVGEEGGEWRYRL